MTKRLLIAMALLMTAGYGVSRFFAGVTDPEWGHYFSFENRLGIEIDSLEISVGDVKTMLYTASDSLGSLEGNIDVPEVGYPHHVTIRTFSKGKVMILKADSFDCYNCDGSHEYILKESGAEYRFHN